MAQRLKLHILDGPLIGQSFEVPTGRCSIGGKGSDATLQLAGLPHGIRFIELVENNAHWGIAEFEQRTALLNQKPLKRRDRLSDEDTISLPSLTRGQPFRMRVEVELYKAEKSRKKAKINPLILAGGGAYLMMMVLGALYFVMMGDKATGPTQLTMADVIGAVEADVAQAAANPPVGPDDVLLDRTPTTYAQLAVFLASDAPQTRKAEMSRAYSDTIVALFSDAWRFEQQGRFDDARDRYQQAASAMGRRDLATTELALRRLNAIRAR